MSDPTQRSPARKDAAQRRAPSSPITALALLVAALGLATLAAAREVAAPAPIEKQPPPEARGLRDDGALDVNTATRAELELLPRIGPALAGRILEARPFSGRDDLVRVSGIGPRTLERLAPLVCAGDECATAPARALAEVP